MAARAARAGAALLLLWVLAAHTYGDFQAVRTKLLTTPVSGQQSISLPLDAARDSREPYVAVIYRIRNDGTTPITVTARAGKDVLGRASIAAGASKRIDLVSPRATTEGAAKTLDLHGSNDRWTLEFVEVANLHGFTRGAVDFLILPRLQPFGGPPVWVWIGWIAWLIGSVGMREVRWSRWPRLADRVLLVAVAAFFAAVAISPLITPFRIAISSGTFASALLLLLTPQLVQVILDRRQRIHAWLTRIVALGNTAGSRAGEFMTLGAKRTAPQLAGVGRWVQERVSFRALLAAASIGYGLLLLANIGVYAGGADSSGYLSSARLLLEGRASSPIRPVEAAGAEAVPPTAYVPLGFRSAGTGDLAPSYPVGMPFLIALFATVAGLTRGAAIMLAAHAVAGVLLIVWLARECGLSRRIAAIAALLLASGPVYLFMTVTLMSDVPALVWTTAAVVMAWRSRTNADWAIAAGIAAALAVLIRPTNALVFAPVAACLGLSPRRWLGLIAGGLPGAVFLIAYNVAAYGDVVATGYTDLDLHFSLANVLPSLRHYAVWFPVVLTPIGVLALGLPALLPRAPRFATVLMLWIGVYLAFYAPYSYTNDAWWYTRFLLPAFPPLIVGSLWFGREALTGLYARSALRRLPSRTRSMLAAAGVVLLAASIAAHNVWWGRHYYVLGIGQGERKYLEVAEWTRSHLPAGAGVLAMQASGALFYYTDFPVMRWDFIDGEALRSLAADAVPGRRPLYAVLFPFDFELDVRNRLQGRWVRVGAVQDVTVWRFDGLKESVGPIPASERWFDSPPTHGTPDHTSSSAIDQ